ncbi:phosphate acyltransferase [Aerococcus urinae]|uniref:phosphate acyltransferase n=1 Tax=Aerococcus urinae TaxID=1376 RepID=UPI002551C0A8|nr:phosphate acyltransferase [Aerococcus urinae]MDK7195276.1 phosphate acyltransferase [Aerococcus urinae]MDK7918664.1 phosphate acyltransferase [Aerococcus urinae]
MKSFEELLTIFQPKGKVKVGFVNALDQSSIETASDPRIKDYIEPVFLGDKAKIDSLVKDYQLSHYQVLDVQDDLSAAKLAVEKVHQGEIQMLCKGKLPSSHFLRPIVNKESGIVRSGLLSTVTLLDIPQYPKLLINTDGGMNLNPNFDQKKIIIRHAIEVMNDIGIQAPKIAVLGATEEVNEKIPSSKDAYDLMKVFSQDPDFKGSIAGPISLDLALSQVASQLKDYHSEVAGQADILISPDMTTGNILSKALTVLGKGRLATIVKGAQVPIVMNSRGSSSDEKVFVLLLALFSWR